MVRKCIEYVLRKKRIRSTKKLFEKFFLVTERYCDRKSGLQGPFLINKLRNEVILKNARKLFALVEKRVDKIKASESSVNELLQELSGTIITKDDYREEVQLLAQKNFYPISDQMVLKHRVMFWNIVYMCTFYPDQGKDMFGIDEFIESHSWYEQEIIIIQGALEEAIKEVESFA